MFRRHDSAWFITACALSSVASHAPLAQPQDQPAARTRWIVEFDGPTCDIEALRRKLDAEMIAVSDDYASHRVGDFGMDPPEIVVLKQGTFIEWSRETGRLPIRGPCIPAHAVHR